MDDFCNREYVSSLIYGKKAMICIHLRCDMIKGGKTGMVENLFLLTKLGFQYLIFCRIKK